MTKQINVFFFFPLILGEYIKKRFGIRVKGILAFFIIQQFLTTFVTIMTNGFDIWLIKHFIPSCVQTYLSLGMLYVIFFIWRNRR